MNQIRVEMFPERTWIEDVNNVLIEDAPQGALGWALVQTMLHGSLRECVFQRPIYRKSVK